MNWNAFMVVLPINILIIWAIIDDIREIIREKEQQRIREANLLRDTIHIDLSYEDYIMEVNNFCKDAVNI